MLAPGDMEINLPSDIREIFMDMVESFKDSKPLSKDVVEA
jgi:hypothetical protein